MRRAPAALALLLLGAGATAGAAAPTVPQLFGARVSANARFKQPFASADFDGDGKQDALYLVSVASGPSVKDAADVSVLRNLFGPAAPGPEKLALAFAMGSGAKFLVTGHDFFATPIWSEGAPPLSIAKRGSAPFGDFKRQEKRIANDITVLGTEAGIDIALYWDGKGFALFEPNEEP